MFAMTADGEMGFDEETHERIAGIMRRLPHESAAVLELELEEILIEIEDCELEPEEAEIEVYLLLDDARRDMAASRRPLIQ